MPAEGRTQPEDTAYLTVHVEPADAQLWVDGVKQPEGIGATSLKLAPGKHKIEAKLPGHQDAWREVNLESGSDNDSIELRLIPVNGRIVVTANKPNAEVLLDGKVVGRGRYEGVISPGLHEVRVIAQGQDESLEVLVYHGKTTTVDQVSGGILHTDAPATRDGSLSHTYQPPWLDPPRVGMYAIAYVAMLNAINAEAVGMTQDDSLQAGLGGSLRLGYRFLNNLGAEAMFQYSVQFGSGSVGSTNDVGYTLDAARVGAMARLFAPGRTKVRFVAAAGGGAVWNLIRWTPGTLGSRYVEAVGWDGFGQMELGVEYEEINILTALSLFGSIQTTGGLAVEGVGESAFGDKILFTLGPMLSVGYGLW